jgi:hypothetical protein
VVTEDARRPGPRAPWGVFRSLAAPGLRQWVSGLPGGSSIVIEASFGPNRVGGPKRPPTALETECKDFAGFCLSKNLEVLPFGSMF